MCKRASWVYWTRNCPWTGRRATLIHSLTLIDSRHTYSYFVTALHATANEAESMPIVWNLVPKMALMRYVEKLLGPLTLVRGLSKLAFSSQHQDTARGLRARMASDIAKVLEAGKIIEGYKLKGKNACAES
jgi:hypothetical protein